MERILSSRNVKIMKTRNDISPLTACIWVMGLVAGILCSVLLWTANSSDLRNWTVSYPTVFGFTSTLAVPIVFAVTAVLSDRRHLLYPLLFFRSFTAVLWGSAVTLAFGSAGWLIRFLFLFSDIFTAPLYFWFCSRRLSEKTPPLLQDLILVSLGSLMIGLIDITLVSPFLLSLLKI